MSKRSNHNFPRDFPFHKKAEESEFVHMPQNAPKSGRKFGLALIVILLLSGAAYGLFKTFYEIGSGISKIDPASVPVITAENTPFKELPENPGGLNIPNLDKQIYNKLDKDLGATIDQNEDSLLPLPNRDDLMEQLAEEEDKKQKIKQVISNKKNIPNIPMEGYGPPKQKVEKDQPEKVESSKAKRIDVDKVLAKKNLQEIWIQLGTFKAEDEATKSWQEVREKNSDIFGDVGIRVTKSENASGAYYRLQSGPVYNEEEARELCKRLNDRQQSCFYVNTKE